MNKLEAMVLQQALSDLYESTGRFRKLSEQYNNKASEPENWNADSVYHRAYDIMRGINRAVENIEAIKGNNPELFK